MYRYTKVLFVFLFVLIMVSCKNDVKEEQEVVAPQQTEKTSITKGKKTELTQEQVDQINSVMSRLMVNPELKKFSSLLVTVGLTDILSTDEGPYTVLAPSNKAFDSLNVEKWNFLLNPVNKEALTTLLKAHIVKGNFDSAVMLQSIKKNNGNLKLETLEGENLTVSKQEMDIIISDGKNGAATMTQSDINGSNGVVHVLDAVLYVD